jgi:hypothetical protein
MNDVMGHVVHDRHPGSEMRPRRWYNDEIPPSPRRSVRLSTSSWRYRSFIRQAKADAAPKFRSGVGFLGGCRSSEMLQFWAAVI